MSVSICTSDDAYVREVPRWVVCLSDGTTVYQDDDRPGTDPASAWLRLGMHCRESGVWVAEMRLQFRSHVVPIEPAGAGGYYFAKSAASACGEPGTWHAYVCGVLADDGTVRVGRWGVPALDFLGGEIREVSRDSPCLICRPPEK